MIIDRMKLNFFVARSFKRIGLVDRNKYRAYLNVLNIISNHKDLICKEAKLVNRIELSHQNDKNVVKVKVYFKNSEKYILYLSKEDYILTDDAYSLQQIAQSLQMIFGTTKRNDIKYKIIKNNKKTSRA